MRPVDADVILQEIDDLMKSPWFHWGEDTYKEHFLVRKEAVEIVRDLCVRNAPTIDAVPVVRCKDCVCGIGPNENGWYMCDNTGGGYPADGYCSDGERRNADETGND